MELADTIALMRVILEIALRCMEHEDMPDRERAALKEAAPLTLLDNVWRMMIHGGLIDVNIENNCPRITLKGLEWLARHGAEEEQATGN